MGELSKVDERLVEAAFANPARVDHYRSQAVDVGLWQSERVVFDRYVPRGARILDLGCGTGRVALGLARSGFDDVVGVDLTRELVDVARELATSAGLAVDLRVGNARHLDFRDASFDAVVFAFNGLMQIPGRPARQEALAEVLRVLRPGGVFVFTTHDRDKGTPEQMDFWREEAQRWSSGRYNARLHDLGDILFESSGREQFIHIPSRAEVLGQLTEAGLVHVEDLWRADIADERPDVRQTSQPCRFWVARKP